MKKIKFQKAIEKVSVVNKKKKQYDSIELWCHERLNADGLYEISDFSSDFHAKIKNNNGDIFNIKSLKYLYVDYGGMDNLFGWKFVVQINFHKEIKNQRYKNHILLVISAQEEDRLYYDTTKFNDDELSFTKFSQKYFFLEKEKYFEFKKTVFKILNRLKKL